MTRERGCRRATWGPDDPADHRPTGLRRRRHRTDRAPRRPGRRRPRTDRGAGRPVSTTPLLEAPGGGSDDGGGASDADATPPSERRRPRPPWVDGLVDHLRPDAVITFVVVAVCVVFTFVELQPGDIFANTTPAGGDMGAHVWLPQFLKSHLLGHLRVTGWAPGWYDGFPALTFYFPLPMWAIALASYIIPYNIAFKLVVVSGLLTLPIAAWFFGRAARLPFPGPACLSVASVGYLFCRDFTIYGGNIASTMAGEFSFSISLSFALVFLGLVARGLRTGRHRALAAVVLALCATSHILPMFFALGGAVVLTLMMRPTRQRILRWTVPVVVIGLALTAFWALPFEYRLPYATNMGYQKVTTYISSLFPPHDLWLFLLAAAGITLSAVRRERFGMSLGVLLVLAAVIFRVAPQARLWNARVLPFWFLLLYLLAGVALAQIGTLVAEAVTRHPRDVTAALLPVPIVALILALVWVLFPLRDLPGGTTTASGRWNWAGITSSDNSFVVDWVKWNLSGYQSSGKAREAEYFSLVNTMGKVGKKYGCGRADWEYEPELDQMGTPDALMLLPYWTNGCIASQEGLYYESSATTPYHFLNESELSMHPADPERGLDYSATTTTGPDGQTVPNVAAGVAHLQMLGVKYYMALNPQTQAQADADPALTLVATVGPYPVTYTNSTSAGGSGSGTQVVQRTWKIYEIADSQLVAPLTEQPVVVRGVSSGGNAWLDNSQSWYLDPSLSSVVEAASGPSSWARVDAAKNGRNPLLPRQPLPPVTVSRIKSNDDSIDFHVSRTGVPVLVRMSYFPNWKVSGAKGVYRVTPNLMVVIPTSTHVHLHYGYTPIDWLGFLLSLAGVAGVVWLWRSRPPSAPRRRRVVATGPPTGRSRSSRVAATAGGVSEPYELLGAVLAGAMAPSEPAEHRQDLDMWLGHPGGLGVARFYASEWQGEEVEPTGGHAVTGETAGGEGGPGAAAPTETDTTRASSPTEANAPAPAADPPRGAERPGEGGGGISAH
jgi:hypothetical protein